jgi:hypothetical protein
MLLQRKRILEGMWAFYSLVRYLPGQCQLVVHDDGSLQGDDVDALKGLFPACLVIRRPEADALANDYFAKNQLAKCRQFRDSFIFGLKLFDVALWAKSSAVLLLDSDVLFFQAPNELVLRGGPQLNDRSPLYMQDAQDGYSIGREAILQRVGVNCVKAFNAGLALVSLGSGFFARMENWLKHDALWISSNGSVHQFAEQTLWAIEMSRANALPLPTTYVIAPMQPGNTGMVCCHYCGGLKQVYLFYTDGIPSLRADLRQQGLLALK